VAPLNLEPDPITEVLRPEPRTPEDVMALKGYLGRSDDPNNMRLHRNVSHNLWVEIPTEAIRHRETISVPGVPGQLSVVWVPANTPLRARLLPNDECLADFLRGTFTAHDLLLVDPSTGHAAPNISYRHYDNRCI
jgi:hypothetical protein